MSNRTEVINNALVEIGANTIAAPTEQSEQARKAEQVFKRVAQAEMRRQVWSFAKKRATLAPLADTTIGGQDYKVGYNLPADCLRLVSLNGNWVFPSIREVSSGGQAAFAIEGSTLVSNDRDNAPAYIVYVSDKSDLVGQWDPAFVDAFVYRLASTLVQTITKNQSLRDRLKKDYMDALREAKRTNAIELPPQVIADDSWVLARYW